MLIYWVLEHAVHPVRKWLATIPSNFRMPTRFITDLCHSSIRINSKPSIRCSSGKVHISVCSSAMCSTHFEEHHLSSAALGWEMSEADLQHKVQLTRVGIPKNVYCTQLINGFGINQLCVVCIFAYFARMASNKRFTNNPARGQKKTPPLSELVIRH